MRLRIAVAVASVVVPVVSGCGDWIGEPEAPPLPGERIPVLTFDRQLRPDPKVADLEVRLPRPMPNADWPQAGGMPNHAMHHLQVGGALTRAWRADVGSGSSDSAPMLAQPVIAGGMVFTMDSDAEVRAFEATTGERKWATELAPKDDDEGILGGGLAVAGGRVFATSGFAQVIALDAKSGKVIWRKRVGGPVRAAPTVSGGRVFVVTVANELLALSAADGRTLWNHIGITESAGLLGGGAPAVDDGIVVAPYSSGEIVALKVENGREMWSDSLSPSRRTDPVSSISHIRGRPVIDRGLVFAVGHSGRMVAFDLASGNRVWEQPIGGLYGPWVAGDFIYVISNESELVCLVRRDGRVRWVRPLQRFEDEEDRTDPIRWAGPVMATDRLLVAGSHGEVWSVSPYTGSLLGRMEVSGSVAIPPAVANQTVYLLTDEADLLALR